jgi:hypothetical protein
VIQPTGDLTKEQMAIDLASDLSDLAHTSGLDTDVATYLFDQLADAIMFIPYKALTILHGELYATREKQRRDLEVHFSGKEET